MIKKSVMWTTVFVFLAGISLWFMFTANPEDRVVASPDGVVTVTGVARASAPIVVSTVTDARPLIANNVTVGSSYLITPDVTPLVQPVVLSWKIDWATIPTSSMATSTSSGLAVYRFNEDSLMWEMVQPIVAYSETMLAVETSTLGTFALGQKETVTTPQFVDVYSDILKTKPEGAVGFVTTVGYAPEGGSIVRLSSVGQQGGCGGAVEPGVSEQRSSVTRDVNLLVNDVQTKVTLTFFTRWFMGDGCPVDAPFLAAQNYGILPS